MENIKFIRVREISGNHDKDIWINLDLIVFFEVVFNNKTKREETFLQILSQNHKILIMGDFYEIIKQAKG